MAVCRAEGICRVAAAWGNVGPAKKRSSTSLAISGSLSESFDIASSTASRSLEAESTANSESSSSTRCYGEDHAAER